MFLLSNIAILSYIGIYREDRRPLSDLRASLLSGCAASCESALHGRTSSYLTSQVAAASNLTELPGNSWRSSVAVHQYAGRASVVRVQRQEWQPQGGAHEGKTCSRAWEEQS